MTSHSDYIVKIGNAKNYFERLGLPLQSTTTDVVKKQYRKIALHIHPDKCSHSRSTEIFKLLTEAYECLINPTTQLDYIRKIQPSRANRPSYFRTPTQPTTQTTYKKRKQTEEDIYEEVKKNHPRKPAEKQPNKPSDKKKAKTHTTYHFSYNNTTEPPKKEESQPSHKQFNSLSCVECKRQFPSEAALKRHILFADYNHKFPSGKKQDTPKPQPEDIFV